ncbi:MAG: hypothetical protein KAT70_04075, partial [Thermoplasmata archaeon]|nr:hypothetical protein [Thermoplasmata archaeon]
MPKGSSGAVAILLATLFLAASFYGYTSITAHLTPATPGCSAPSLPLSIGTGSGGIDPPPEANTQRSSSYKYELTWELGDVYPEWGGVMSVSLTNTGGNTIYINSLGIRGDWIDSGINLEKGIYVEPGEKEGLGIIPFPGPHYSNPNRYYHYQLALGFLVL